MDNAILDTQAMQTNQEIERKSKTYKNNLLVAETLKNSILALIGLHEK